MACGDNSEELLDHAESAGEFEQTLDQWIESAYDALLSSPQVPIEIRTRLLELYFSRSSLFG